MANNLIELVIKSYVEGTADVNKLTEVVTQLAHEAQDAAKQIASSADANKMLAGSAEDVRKALVGSLAPFVDQLDSGIAKVRELQAAIEASGGAALPEIQPLVAQLGDIEQFYSGIKGTFDSATQSSKLFEDAIAKVQEGLRAGIQDAKAFEEFLRSDKTPGLTPSDIIARDIFPSAEFFKQTDAAIEDTVQSATELDKIYSSLITDSIEALAKARELAAAKEVPLSAEQLDRASSTGLSAGLEQIAEATAKSRDLFELLAQESRESLRAIDSESDKAATGLRDVSDAGDEAVKSVSELERLSISGFIDQLGQLESRLPKDAGQLAQDSAAGFNAAMQQLADITAEADKGLNTARLSVQELDDELARLSQTLAEVGINADQGLLRGFTVDAAKDLGVGEGVVTGVMEELASSIQGLTQKELEELTRAVITASQAFKTDFIVTAQEAAQVANGLSDTVKNTTVSIDELATPQERVAKLTAELNKGFEQTGEKAGEGGKGIEGLNTAMTSFGAIAGSLNPKLGQLQNILGGFTRNAIPIVAITGLAAGFLALAKEAANAGAELRRTAQINGFTVETMSALKIGAEQSDSSLGALSIGLRTLNRELAQAVTQGGAAQKKFIELGITYDQLTDFYVDSESALEAVARRITATASATERTRLAIQFFGRQGRELIPLLKEISEKGLAGMRDEAERAGLIVSTQAANAAKVFNDNLTTLNQTIQGFVFRSMGPFLESFNKFVADSPEIVKALGAIALGFGAIALAIGAAKIASLLALKTAIENLAVGAAVLLTKIPVLTAAFNALGLAILAHPYIAAAVAIAAAAAAIAGAFKLLSNTSKTAGLSLEQIADRTLTAKEKLAELEKNGRGAGKMADDLRKDIDELGKAAKEGEAKLKALSDELDRLQKERADPETSKTRRQVVTQRIKEVEAELAAKKALLEGEPKKPFEVTQKSIQNTTRELDNLIISGTGSAAQIKNLQTELARLKALLGTQIDAEVASLNAEIAKLEDSKGSAEGIRKRRVEIERLLALKERTTTPKIESETAKQFDQQIKQLNIQLQKSIVQAGQQTTQQLLQETGDVNAFFKNITDHIDKLRDLAQKEIELQFKVDEKNVDPAKAAELRTAREQQAELQRQQALADARSKASEAQLKVEQDRQGAIEAAAKAEEALRSAKLESQQQNLDILLTEVSTLDEVIDRSKQIVAQQKANLQLSIQNLEARRAFLSAQLAETAGQEDSEVTPQVLQQRAALKSVTVEIEKAKAAQAALNTTVSTTVAKFRELRDAARIEAKITVASTELDTLQDKLSKLQVAQDLGANVPFSQFLEIAKQIDSVQQRINQAEIERQELLVKTIQLKREEGAASQEQLDAAIAQLDRLKNQAVISATAVADKQLEDLERKINEVAGNTAKNFVDRLIEGLEAGKADFQAFFQNMGKALFSELLQEAIKESLKPALRAQAQLTGEKPADTLGGQFIQQAKFLLNQVFGVQFAKKTPELTAAEKAAQQQTEAAKAQTDSAAASKEASQELKTSSQNASVKLIEAGGVLKTAGDSLLNAANALSSRTQPGVPTATQEMNNVQRAIAGINARIDSALQRKESLTARLSEDSTDDIKQALQDQLDNVNDEIRAMEAEIDNTLKVFGDAGTKASTAITRSTESQAAKIGEVAGTLKVANGELFSAAKQLQACYCSAQTPTTPSRPITQPLPVEITKPVELSKDLNIDFLDSLEEVDARIAARKASEAAGLTTALEDVAEALKPDSVKLAGAESMPTSDPAEFFRSAIQDIDEDLVKVGLEAAQAVGQKAQASSGFDFSGLQSLLPGGMSLGLGIGGLMSKGSGAQGILSKIIGASTALKGGLEIFQALQGMFGGFSPVVGGAVNAAGLGSGFIGTGMTGIEAASSAIDIGSSSGGFWASLLSLFGFADGGMAAPAMGQTGFTAPNQLGNLVSMGQIRKFRAGDMVRGPTLGVLAEEGPEIVARMKPAGYHDVSMGGGDDGMIKQNIYLVDQRRPNLAPNDVELIITDSMSRGKGVAKAVENVLKRKGGR